MSNILDGEDDKNSTEDLKEITDEENFAYIYFNILLTSVRLSLQLA